MHGHRAELSPLTVKIKGIPHAMSVMTASLAQADQ
jgi:hypothetical protein